MTEFEIASAIENYVTSHRGVTDSPLSIDQVRDEMDSLRIRLLTEFDIRNRYIYPLEPYMQHITVQTSRKDGQTIAEIPRIYIRELGVPAIGFIGSSSKGTEYKVVTGRHRNWSSDDLWTGKAPTVWYNDGILEFMGGTVSRNIYLEAVFEKPSQLRKYGYDWKKSRYPVPPAVADEIIGKTAESYLRTMYRVPPQPNTQADVPQAAK